jgi:hypothetical protein
VCLIVSFILSSLPCYILDIKGCCEILQGVSRKYFKETVIKTVSKTVIKR